MLAFITHVRAKPGKRQALMDINIEMMRVTHEESGVHVYAFHTEEKSPDDFWYYDLYENQEAFDLHCQTPEFKKMVESLGDLADIIHMAPLKPFGPTKAHLPKD